MAIKSAVRFRRRVCTGLSLLLLAVFSLCGIARAQTPVTSGSVIPTTHDTWGQIMKILVTKSGNVIFLDWSTSGLYQLSPGASTFTTIASGAPLEASGTFWNSGMTMDAKDTIYIADRYGSAHFFRIPYNPADGTYDFTASNAWGATIGNGNVSLNTFDLAFIDSPAKDGSGTLVVATETSPEIFTVAVDNQGNWANTVTIIVKGLKAKAQHIAADVNGNIYFVEDEGVSASSRAPGVYFIPAGKSGIVGAADGTAEAQLTRLDPSSNTDAYDGITLDAAGNLYLSSQSDSNGGAFNGDIMVPNTSGSPIGVSASSFDFNSATLLTPVQSSSPLAIDPRGYFWIPTSTGGWTPPGSLAYPGTKNVVLWQMGAASAGASPVGTAGTPGTVFFNFSSSVTPGSFVFSEPGTGTDFAASSTNPIADPAAVTPQLPCTPGQQYLALTSCPFFVALDPRLPGGVSGKLTMLDSSKNVISASSTYLSGVGQGAAIALSVPTSQITLGSGLVSPQQVAADSQGNAYVADSSLGRVLEFTSGSTSTSTGVVVGSGFTAPTGVAVDGAGDVYVADSGKVYEVPFVNGALNNAGQVTLQTGLGSNLKLAAGLAGNIYVTDPDNSRVIEISNALSQPLTGAFTTIGSGFSKPSAIATDSAGNIFVADGGTLSEIPAVFDGAPAAITNDLAVPVTGIAVDASGSVNVAQSGGILHIPSVSGTLSVNSAVAFDSGVLTAPNGLAIDPFGNLYVSDLTGGTPALRVLTLDASVDLGQVSQFVPSNPVDVDVFNIGNLPLAISPDPTFSGTNAADFSLTPATENACDTTGATTVAPGSSCIIDVQITASNTGTETGTMNVTSNAANTSAVTASLTADGVNNLARSSVALALNPATGVTYPGSTVISVTVSSLAASTTVPTGQVVLSLINQNAKLHQSTTYPAGNLSAGVATFNLTGILGGTYTVKALYHGDSVYSGGLVTTTFTVAQALPGVSLGEPSNITAFLGVYYVPLGSNTSVQASVVSKVGTPTGNVSFMNGTALADPTQNPVPLDANGNAVFSTENLPAGTYNLTAVYNGDQNFSATTSPITAFQVVPKSALITANPSSLSITAGTPVQTLLTLYSLVGYAATLQNGGMSIACDNTTVPQYAECTFDVPHPVVNAGSSGTTTLTISTNLPVNVSSAKTKKTSPFVLASLFGLGLLGLSFRRKLNAYRAALSTLSLVLLLASAALGVSGCTNSGYTTTPPSPHVVTPSGTYNVRIYATDPISGAVATLPYTLPVTVQ